MGEEQQRYEHGHDEIAGAQLTRLEPNLIAPVEGEEEVRRAPNIEDPDESTPESRPQTRQRKQGEERGTEIAVRGGQCPGRCEVRRDHARQQERQANKAEAMEEQNWVRCVVARLAVQLRPYILPEDKTSGDETEQDAHAEQRLRRHR